MKKSSNYQSGVKTITVVMVSILVILAVLFISFVVEFVKEFSHQNATSFDNISIENTSSQTASVETSSEEVSSEVTSSEETSSQITQTPDGVVPESDKVLSNYFSDAVFIGDSITHGLSLYTYMNDKTTILSYTGLGLDNIYTKEVIDDGNGNTIPVMDAVKNSDAKKFYVLLGVNSIGYSKDNFVSKYGAVVDSILSYHPDAIVYVQSITPVCEQKAKANGYKLDNETIKEYNEALIEMAKEKGAYYLDIHSALCDETGALPENATTDGLHFGSQYYQKWINYLLTHTV